jgi:hypothetical protein
VSPDGEHVVFAGSPGIARTVRDVWGGDLTVELGTLDLADNPPGWVAFDPSGQMLVASTSGNASIFDVASHQWIADWTPPGCSSGVDEVEFSRGGGLLVVKVYCNGTPYPPRLDWLRLD